MLRDDVAAEPCFFAFTGVVELVAFVVGRAVRRYFDDWKLRALYCDPIYCEEDCASVSRCSASVENTCVTSLVCADAGNCSNPLSEAELIDVVDRALTIDPSDDSAMGRGKENNKLASLPTLWPTQEFSYEELSYQKTIYSELSDESFVCTFRHQPESSTALTYRSTTKGGEGQRVFQMLVRGGRNNLATVYAARLTEDDLPVVFTDDFQLEVDAYGEIELQILSRAKGDTRDDPFQLISFRSN